ncbi:MAG: secretin and TonB N-terminal domain-containing protein [Candidatus Omnitrophica bacterium]|nr:secretin and TonB N-terminal domain-containing protein [Candidatus Omnitrophota bacterium]
MLKRFVMALVAAGLGALGAWAQAPSDGAGGKQAPIVMVEKAVPGKGATAGAGAAPAAGQAADGADAETQEVVDVDLGKDGNVSLDFREAELRNVLKVLAYKTGVNIIAGPEVEGTVSIQLKDVPWQKALDVILSTYGYSYEQKGDIILVTTVDNLKKRREDAKLLADQEPVTTETFILNFGKAEDAVKSLEKMKTARGSINFDKRTNAIIVTDVSSNLQIMREVVKRLDTVTPQVLIEARIVETTLDKTDTLGIDWNIGGITANGASRATSFPFGKHQLSRGGLVRQYVTADSPSVPVISYGTLSFNQLSATLDLLKSRANTNILSNPRIVTLDNQPAKVQVGQQFPMPQYTFSTQTNQLQISGWTYIDTGIIFNVTPHVNNAQMVTLDIEPRITQILSTLPTGGVNASNATMPILSNEVVSTSVMIKDGDTLVIAGLIKDDVQKTVTRVPILGYIPILGWPFQHTADVHTKVDLVIFLTPHIITPINVVAVDKK